MILQDIQELIEKWLKEKLQLIKDSEISITKKREIEKLAKLDQLNKMTNELIKVFNKYSDNN